MKKLVFGLIATVMFGFAGNAQDKELKENYLNFVKSNEYKEFIETANSFSDKLNIGDGKIEISSNTDFKEWIKENISKTEFKDVYSANSEYDQLLDRAAKLMDMNKDLFGQLAKTSKEDIFELVKNETEIDLMKTVPGNVVNSPCSDGCINDAVSCGRDADDIYATVVGGAWWGGATPAGWAALVGGTIVHRIMLKACVRTLTTCYSACK